MINFEIGYDTNKNIRVDALADNQSMHPPTCTPSTGNSQFECGDFKCQLWILIKLLSKKYVLLSG